MTEDKKTVAKYMEAFGEGNHQKILSCLTEDVIWEMPGAFYLKGKTEFDGEIENPAFSGRPQITVNRLIQENNIVVAEGNVLAKTKDGSSVSIVFCDVIEMESGLIKKLTSYVMQKNPE